MCTVSATLQLTSIKTRPTPSSRLQGKLVQKSIQKVYQQVNFLVILKELDNFSLKIHL